MTRKLVDRRKSLAVAAMASLVALLGGAAGGYSLGTRPVVVELSESPLFFEPERPRPELAGPVVTDGSEEAEAQVVKELPPDTDPATIYVSPEGLDSNDGQTPETALATLPTAVAALVPGMTLYVMEGTYNVSDDGPTLISLVRDGAQDSWTRIVGYGPTRPVIVGRGGTLFEALGSYIEFSGLELRGEGFDQNTSYGYGILLGDGHHFRVTDMVVSGFPVGGIGAVRTSHLYIAGNTVFENSHWGTEQGSGLSIYQAKNYGFSDDEFGYSDYFVNNVVFDNENLVTSRFVTGMITDGNGIIIDNNDETGYRGRTLVANNVIYGNGGRAIWAFNSSRIDIFNNTAFSNVRTGDALNGGRAEIAAADADDVRVINNVVSHDNDQAAYLVKNSDVLFTTNVAFGGPLVGYEGEGIETLTVVPAFTNPVVSADADFSLVSGSPLVDRGSETQSPLMVDQAGTARIVGSAIDLGAYELAGP